MILQVDGLCKTFRDKLTLKKKQVLFDVSFSIGEGSVVGFLGSNGAGKTTTMKCLLGLLQIDKGKISFFDSKYKDPRAYIGYLPERPFFYDYLTGLEFLMFYGQLSLNVSRKEVLARSLELLEKVGIPHAKDLPLRSFSKGMLQRIGLAQAIIHQPKFLILDEPMSGLDPDGRYQMSKLIQEIASQGTTIFFSSHLLDDVEKLCQQIVVINYGRVIFSGPIQDILRVGEGGYEIIYKTATDNRLIAKQMKDLSEVEQFLMEIKKNHLHLVEIREPRIRLEDAFAELKQRDLR